MAQNSKLKIDKRNGGIQLSEGLDHPERHAGRAADEPKDLCRISAP